MDKQRLMQVLLAPQVSEKSTFVGEKNNQYVFRVAADATKPEIKAAVELMFKTKVKSVQVTNVKGKDKRFGRFEGRRRNWKKAYVSLLPGPDGKKQEITFQAQEETVPLVKFKPTSPGRRQLVKFVNPDLHKGSPYQPLVEKQSKKAGRNVNGHITVRQQGGGHKQNYRIVDFRRDKDGIAAKVERLEYEPNRSANIALLCYADGEPRS